MLDFHERIFARATKVIPGAAFNRALEALYNTADLVYEVLLSPEFAWAPFRDRIYPPFIRYLRSKAFNPERPEGAVVAVFFQDRCYLLEARDFIDVLRDLEGLTPGALHTLILGWLQEA
jgi:hypothetical protein